MARSFDGDDNLNFGTGSDVDIGGAFTCCAWVRFPSNFTAERLILAKASSGVEFKHYLGAAGTGQNDIYFALERGVGSGDWCWVISAADVMTAGVWNFVAATWDGTASLPQLYSATMGNTAAETSYAATRQVGTGAFTDTSLKNLRVGSRDSLDLYWIGEIAEVALWNTALTLAELQSMTSTTAHFWPNQIQTSALKFYNKCLGVVPELDISAGAKRATITGTLVTPHPAIAQYGPRPNVNKMRPRAFAPGLAR